MSVLIYAENAGGKFKKSTFEACSYAFAVAKQLNTDLVAAMATFAVPAVMWGAPHPAEGEHPSPRGCPKKRGGDRSPQPILERASPG